MNAPFLKWCLCVSLSLLTVVLFGCSNPVSNAENTVNHKLIGSWGRSYTNLMTPGSADMVYTFKTNGTFFYAIHVNNTLVTSEGKYKINNDEILLYNCTEKSAGKIEKVQDKTIYYKIYDDDTIGINDVINVPQPRDDIYYTRFKRMQ